MDVNRQGKNQDRGPSTLSDVRDLIRLVFVGDAGFDETISPNGKRRSFGGAAYNAAVGASTIADAGTVGVVARVGLDFADGVMALRQRGVDIDGIKVIADDMTAVFQIQEFLDGSRQLRANWGAAGVPHFDLPERYRTARHIHLASSHPAKHLQWLRYFRQMCHTALISADAVDFWLPEAIEETFELLAGVDLVFMTEGELITLRESNRDFKPTGPAVIKKGGNGATYVGIDGSELTVSAPNVVVVDTTGAGDTLAGVFLAALSANVPVADALQMGVRAASIVVTDFGVEHLT
jgi:sugar/nucleoside kinase (ribokinase family)